MATNKSEKKKAHLVHERKTNRRPPVWTKLKAKKNSLLRERKHNWRRSKLGKKLKKKMKKYGD